MNMDTSHSTNKQLLNKKHSLECKNRSVNTDYNSSDNKEQKINFKDPFIKK